MKIITQEFPKSQSNNTDINKTEYSDTDYSETEFNNTDASMYVLIPSNPSNQSAGQSTEKVDVVGEMNAYRQIIRENISYGCFQDDEYQREEEVDELVELMVEVMLMPDNSTIRIAGVDKPVAIVKNRFMKIAHGHIQYAMGCLEKNTNKVGNIKAYLLTVLYNSTLTIGNYYQAEVNHDMYGGGWCE